MTDAQLADLDKQIASLVAKKKSLLAEGRQEALKATKASVLRYEFTASELGLGASILKKTKTMPQTAKAPPKYANPANPAQVWAGGKGARPLWVQSHLADGKSLDDLLIK